MESEVHIPLGLLAPPRRRRDAGAPAKGSAAAAAWQKKQHEVLQFRHNRYTPHKIQLDSQHCTRLPRDYLAERSSTGMRLRGGEACRRRCAPFAPPLVKHLSPVGQPRQVNAAGMGRVHDELWGGARKGRGLAACLDACSDKEHAREHGLEADPLPFSSDSRKSKNTSRKKKSSPVSSQWLLMPRCPSPECARTFAKIGHSSSSPVATAARQASASTSTTGSALERGSPSRSCVGHCSCMHGCPRVPAGSIHGCREFHDEFCEFAQAFLQRLKRPC